MKSIALLTAIKGQWYGYWFAEGPGIGFAVFRIAIGGVLLLYHAPRIFYIRELYTTEGYLFPFYQFFLLHLPFPTPLVAFILYAFLIGSIIALVIGYHTRTATVVILFLHSYFSLLERFSTKAYGAILMIYLLLMIFAPIGAWLSLDERKRRARNVGDDSVVASPLVSLTFQRLMLWQLAAIYFFNALSKLFLGGWGWFDGTYLTNIYRDTGGFVRPFAAALSDAVISNIPFPVFSLLGTVILGGLFFMAFGLLRRDDRPYAIAFGLFYHSFVMATTVVPYVFTLLMFSIYLIAIEPETWGRWWERYHRWRTGGRVSPTK